MRRALLVAVLLTLLTGAATIASRRGSGERPANAVADSLFRLALAHEAALDYGPAFRELRNVLDRDSSALHAFNELFLIVGNPAPHWLLQFLDSMAVRHSTTGLGRCFARTARLMRGFPAGPAEGGAGLGDKCDALVTEALDRPDRSRLERLVRERETPDVFRRYSSILSMTSGWAELVDFSDRGKRPSQPAVIRAAAYAQQAVALHLLGREAEARAIEAAAGRDPDTISAGFAFSYARGLDQHVELIVNAHVRLPDSVAAHGRDMMALGQRTARRLLSRGDAQMRAVEGLNLGRGHLDRGRLDAAIDVLGISAAAADSLADPVLIAYTRMLLGRALAKTGRVGEAEQNLLAARRVISPYVVPATQKEIEHNLLHLYESSGRPAEAREAGEAFVRFASMGGLHQVRMMSARDVGMFYRARGEAERSRRMFARMLADIDSLGTEFYFAAEYHELIGDLDRAREYYMKARSGDSNPVRAFEGLTRLALATGDEREAVHFARLHDNEALAKGIPESPRLLPGVLHMLGRTNEARGALTEARRTALANGQLGAWARLTFDLAKIERDERQWRRVLDLADSAAHAAARVGNTDLEITASALAGVAEAEVGRAWEVASRRLTEAVAASERTRSPQLRAEVRGRYAAGLAATGRWREALHEFDRAATLSDSIAAGIALDPTKAGFRSAQRALYDDALAVVISHAEEPGAREAFSRWSTRRKARGYANSSSGGAGSVQRPTTRGVAVIDYVMLQQQVAALVSTRTRSSIVRLPTTADSLRADIRRLHLAIDARVGSSFDVARARFPLHIAHRLHDQLIAPLLPMLDSIEQLTIIPDGPLHVVPFDALVSAPPRADTGAAHVRASYVVDRFAVSYAVAGSAPARADLPDGRLIAVVPHGALAQDAEREVGALTATWGLSTATVLRGASATESEVRRSATGARVLHFAGHARVNPHEPSESWLALSADTADDGRLHAFEIEQLSLTGTLVVLSACETAAGRILEGEGVLSMARSFMRAGASATVATLWPVGRASAEFMDAFYGALAQDRSPPAALHAAKLALRRRGASPLDWAPYTFMARGPAK